MEDPGGLRRCARRGRRVHPVQRPSARCPEPLGYGAANEPGAKDGDAQQTLGRQLRVNAIKAREEAGHLLRHTHAHPQVLGKAVTPTGRTITPSRRSAS